MNFIEYFASTPAIVEPSAEARAMARQCRELFAALLMEGFDQRQALTIVCHHACGEPE